MKAKITADIKTAMKARNKELITNLRGLMAEIQKIEIDKKTELTDEQIISIIQKEIKKRRDALEFAEKASREDLIAQNKSEIVLLQAYLGEQLSEEELKAIITKLVDEGADHIGKIMGFLNQNYKGKFEGKIASTITKELLGK